MTMNETRLKIRIGGKTATVFCSGNRKAPLVLMNSVSEEEGYRIWPLLSGSDLSLAAISGIRWNDEMTPWPSSPVASWDSGYGGMADSYLAFLTDEILPRIISESRIKPEKTALAGYSLGGLFALYSAFRTAAFQSYASVSGSLWYPGFTSFIASNVPPEIPDLVYISLGDKEDKAGNAAMRTVGQNTGKIISLLQDKGIPIVFESNPGNHFTNAPERMTKAIRYIV